MGDGSGVGFKVGFKVGGGGYDGDGVSNGDAVGVGEGQLYRNLLNRVHSIYFLYMIPKERNSLIKTTIQKAN